MMLIIEDYLSVARNFQNHGQHELAVDALKQALELDFEKMHYITICKLLCFNDWKMNKFDMALIHIIYALSTCLMNNGIVFEEQQKIKKTPDCHLPAVNIIKRVYKSVPSENGLLINALLTVGMLYYKLRRFVQTKRYLESELA